VGVDERWVPSVRPPSAPHRIVWGHIEGSQSVWLSVHSTINHLSSYDSKVSFLFCLFVSGVNLFLFLLSNLHASNRQK